MAVMMPREAWTDERLDDLNYRVESGFTEMREEFRSVRAEMRDIRTEIGALNRTVAQVAFGLAGVILVGFLGTIAALITLA